ncbi:MAG: molybdopterin-dependent oxidoreductase [Candidatus Bathyarchaeota archaeon]|nr:molybdopterin-dependent oxidoreductase [Candidatus Bathyarchaeota archaeon]
MIISTNVAKNNTKIYLTTGLIIIILVAGIVTWQLYPSSQSPSASPTPSPSANPTAPPTTPPEFDLTIIGANGTTIVLNKNELLALSAYTASGGYISQNIIHGYGNYTGIPVYTLCEIVGGVESDDTVEVTASDGYTMTYTRGQVNGQGFACYNPTTGSEAPSTDTMVLMVAYYQDGAPLSSDQGPLRIVIVGPEGLATPGNQWVKYATKITVIASTSPTASPTPTTNPTASPTPTTNPTASPTPTTNPTASPSTASTPTVSPSPTATPTPTSTPKPTATPAPTATPTPEPKWYLGFSGGNTANMSSLTFEAQASQNAVTYADSSSTWSGIPLYQLVDWYINAGNINSGALTVGYNVTVIAGDGYTCELNGTRVNANNNIIVANVANGTALTGSNYPLTLTGSDLTKKETVKNIVQIRVDVALPDLTLTVVGSNGTTLVFNSTSITTLPSVSAMGGYNAHGTITGVGNYTGISVLSLCNMVGGINNNSFIQVTASDTYTKSFTYEQLTAGTGFAVYDPETNNSTTATQPLTVIIAYAVNGTPLQPPHGPLKVAIVGPEGLLTISSLWVKDIIQINVYQLA